MRKFFTFLLCIFIVNFVFTQSNPTPHNLAASNFVFDGFANGTTTTYPVSMQGWSFSEEANSSTVGSANADRILVNSSGGITSGSIRNEISNGLSLLNSGSNNIGAIAVSLNTTNRENISLTWTAEQLNSGGSGATDRINGLQLQFRVGVSGNFTTVAGTEYLATNTTSQNPPQTFSSIILPASCNNQAIVQVRWIYYISSGTANGRDRIRLDDITISSSAMMSCAQPTTGPSNFSATELADNSMDISWMNGDGDRVLVLAREGAAVNADPVNGTPYDANAAFGLGDPLGTVNFVVYNGTGTSESITNLMSGTTYHYAVYAYNDVDQCYNTVAKLTGSGMTTSPPAPIIQLEYPTDNNVNCGFTLPYGNVDLNTDSDLTFRISNDGNADLTLTLDLTIGGTNANQFSIITQPTSPIGAGLSSDVTVRFTPTSGGSKTASISIGNNSAQSTCVVNLSGTGVTPPYYYQTKTSGNWSTPGTWEVSTDNSTWEEATEAPLSNKDLTITIKSPHNVTISANTTIDETVIDAGGSLEVTGGTFTIANGDGEDLQVFGVLRNSLNVQFSLNSGSEISIKNGGKYEHNAVTAGSITPMTWNSGSTCEIIKASGTPGNLNQSYHHFIWASTSHGAATLNLSGDLKTINGDFSITNTGTGSLRLAGATGNTLNVGGSVSINNGTTLDLGNGGNTSNLNILGNLSVFGELRLMGAGTNNGTINLSGNLTGSGTITENTSGTNCQIFFSGTSLQEFNFSGTISNSINFTINNGNNVDLQTALNLPAALTLTNGRLRLNTFDLTVAGTISGASATSYIQTNGTGKLLRTVTQSPAVEYPVGNSTYNPASLQLSSTSSAQFGVRVLDAVYEDGLSGTPITQKVVNRTWDVTGTIPGNFLTLEVQWSTANEAVDFTRTACYLSHYEDMSWSGDVEGAATGTNPYTRSRNDIGTLSPFAVGSQGVLPVEFLDFNVKASGRTSLLSFSTATEFNNDYFSIERSSDGRDFDMIGEIKGAGNSNREISYEFTDSKPSSGINYYRIKQTDFDGKYSYSDIKSIQFSSQKEISVSPGYTDGRLQISTESESYNIVVLNTSGQEVRRFRTLSQNQTISIEELKAGLYFLNIFSGDFRETVRIVKF
ncbi:MAG: choice-of-anchor D domain-containing protein [Saprospiraceae bacterium]|nr:choice-of-anchor D domain-containing protein [Saprospiraceae bacterium]